jgi:hypothetical protein
MATIKFQLRGKKNPSKITVRLSIGRGKIFRAKTEYVIDRDKWSYEKHLPKQGDNSQKNLKTKLKKLETTIDENLNNATSKGIEIDSEWLQQQVDIFNQKVTATDDDRLVNCIQAYIDYLPRKKQRKGKRGASVSTIKKHKALKVKIENFEQYRKKKIQVKDVGPKFIEEMEKYFSDVELLCENTTGSYIKFTKTVCTWAASEKNIKAHPKLDSIKYYTCDATKVFLSFDELETIENTTFERSALENAKDWLIIGCYIGQRVSDL